MDFTVAAVLPAAGCGLRMDLDRPKQFVELGDKPLLCHPVDAFQRIDWLGAVVVVIAAPPADADRKLLSNWLGPKVSYASGGTTRHRSIWNGLKALSASPPHVVIIHDGVRPFVDEEMVKECAMLAWQHGACGMTRPLVSTVLLPDSDGFLSRSLDRSKYKASEMPQAFRYELIVKAYERCCDDDLDYGTECLHLALTYCGVRAKLIDGPDTLWKVTYKKDLYAAEHILKERRERSPKLTVVCSETSALAEVVRECVLVIRGREETFLVTGGKFWGKVDVAVPGKTIIPVAMVTDTRECTQLVTEICKVNHHHSVVSHILLILLACSTSLDVFQIQQQICDLSRSLSIHAVITQCECGRQPSVKNKDRFVNVLRDILSLDGKTLSGQLFIA